MKTLMYLIFEKGHQKIAKWGSLPLVGKFGLATIRLPLHDTDRLVIAGPQRRMSVLPQRRDY